MKNLSILILLISITHFSCNVNSESSPNVIIILTDDQGSIDANAYGASDLKTPNIDRLASEGLMFTRFYVGSSICSPSRASLLTGLTPQSAGVPGNVSSIPGNPGMPLEQITLAEIFKEAGYTTGHVGKWHLGYSKETTPLSQGFDYSFGHMGGCIDNYSHFFYWNGPNRHDLWENDIEIFMDGEYFPDLMAEKAAHFINENQKEPFFLYYAINTPHYPLQPRDGWREYYKDMDMPRRDYAGFVSTADENIGYVLNLLDKLKIREKTIVLYMSDHGHSYETRTFGGGGSAGPFRGGKTSLFEGGIRVPSIISWPATIPEGELRNQVVHSIDILPSILSMCSIDKTPDNIEGIDLSKAIIENAAIEDRPLYWKLGSQWAVRRGDWKLIALPRDPSKKGTLDPEKDRYFLSNLGVDSTEMVNQASVHPEKVQTLILEYLNWKNSDQDDLPEPLSSVSNVAIGKNISLVNQPAEQYSAKGNESLIDGNIGTRSHDDGFWLGFEEVDLNAVIDLGVETDINSISARFLNSPGSWIFYPTNLAISYSLDGANYSVGDLKGKIGNNLEKPGIAQYSFDKKIRTRYIKLLAQNCRMNPEWHPSPGGKSWLFCDEIIIK